MDFLIASAPTGLWAWLINSIENAGISYGFTIILVTLIIKFVLLPADLFNKYSTKKNATVQAKIKPELDTLKKRYANNPQILNQKTMQLYKRENYSMGGTCAGMLVYMVLTMVIFFTLLNTLNGMSAYKLQNEYDVLYNTYTAYVTENNIDVENEEELKLAQVAVSEKYNEIKEDFLWIKNIWRPDTSASVTLNYKDFSSVAKISEKQKHGTEYSKLTEEELAEIQLMTDEEKAEYNKYTEKTYNIVMNELLTNKTYTKWNGYFILSVLAALLSFGSMQLNTIIAKIKNKKKNLPNIVSTNKTMSIIMPIIMGVFTLLYTASFGLYIVAGALFSFVTTPLITLIVDKIYAKKSEKLEVKNKVSYDRTLKK